MWINEQCDQILSTIRHALRQIKKTAKPCASKAGGKPLQILVGNLVFVSNHLEGENQIQDS